MTAEKQKGNEIIARSGYSEQANLQIEHFTDSGNEYGLKEYLHNLSFHSDWNALIEVWAKVYQELLKQSSSIWLNMQQGLEKAVCENDINLAFKIVVRSIELIKVHKSAKP